MRVERLDAQDLSGFDCGQARMNEWLKRQAKESMRGRSAVVYLAYDGINLVGYFSLSNGAILRDDAPLKIRTGQPSMIPLVLLGRLAVDIRWQRRGFAERMFMAACQLSVEVAQRSGVVAIRVDALDDSAAAFWEKVGCFEAHPTAPNRLFLPLKGVALTSLDSK